MCLFQHSAHMEICSRASITGKHSEGVETYGDRKIGKAVIG